MTKKILPIMLGTLLTASITYAAPTATVEQGQTSLDYAHYNFNHEQRNDSFAIEHGLSANLALGVEHNNYSNNQDFNTTDITLQYKLDKNIYLLAGNRTYSDNSFSDRFVYGIGASVNLAPQLDGYASYTGTSVSNESQFGILYKVNSQTALNVGYKSYKDDFSPTFDGIGFGVKYSF